MNRAYVTSLAVDAIVPISGVITIVTLRMIVTIMMIEEVRRP